MYTYGSQGLQQARIGTIAGRHTLAETRQILDVADYRFDEVDQAIAEAHQKVGADPAKQAALAAVDADWAKLLATWVPARKDLVQKLTLKAAAFPVLPADAIPTEDEYTRVLSFTQGQELVPGSLQDITRRTEGLIGRPILFRDQPRSDAGDLDLDLFQELDRQIKAGQGAVDQLKKETVTTRNVAILGTAAAVLLGLYFFPQIAQGIANLRRSDKKRR